MQTDPKREQARRPLPLRAGVVLAVVAPGFPPVCGGVLTTWVRKPGILSHVVAGLETSVPRFLRCKRRIVLHCPVLFHLLCFYYGSAKGRPLESFPAERNRHGQGAKGRNHQ